MADIWCYRAGRALFEFSTSIAEGVVTFRAIPDGETAILSRKVLFAPDHGREGRVDPPAALSILRGIVERLSSPDCPLMYVYSGNYIRSPQSTAPPQFKGSFSRGLGTRAGDRAVALSLGPGVCEVTYRWGANWEHAEKIDARGMDYVVALDDGDEIRFKRKKIDSALITKLERLIAFIEAHQHETIIFSVRRGPPWGKPAGE